ncbi:MAG: hypothetical protein RSC01_09020, partial [Oscillospiraceae bacterium]
DARQGENAVKYKNQYIIKTTVAGETIEVQKTQSSRYGHAIPRCENIGSTPSAVQKINQINAERTLRQLINTNFCNDDYHVVLTYKKSLRPLDIASARLELKLVLRRLREDAKKQGIEIKYIGATEIGEKGAVHHHIVLSHIDTRFVTSAFKRRITNADGKKEWVSLGTARFYSLWSDGQYKDLSNYIIKQTSLTLRKAGENGKRYFASRSLKKPETKSNVVDAKTWRKVPKPPKGYMFDPALPLVNGVCEVTGLAYQRYAFIKIKTYKARYQNYMTGAN